MNIFQQLFRMAEFCMTVRFTPLWSIAILSTNMSQGSVATHFRGGGIFYYRFATNLLLSLSVKNLKVDQHFGKVRSKHIVAPFSRHGA